MTQEDKKELKTIKVVNNRLGIEKLERIAKSNEILKVKNIGKILEATIRK